MSKAIDEGNKPLPANDDEQHQYDNGEWARSYTPKESWKEKFEYWLTNNMYINRTTAINIVDHVERYFVKARTEPQPIADVPNDEKYWKGFEAALELIEDMYGSVNFQHENNICDCVKAKMNRLPKSKIRPSKVNTEANDERRFSLEDLEAAHCHGWFVRERYTGPDRHGYEDRLPKNWGEMDYDEHEDWFFEQFKNKKQ